MRINQVPILKFPTTALLLDDDQIFLNHIAKFLENKTSIITFDDPKKATSHLRKQKSLEKQIMDCCKTIDKIELNYAFSDEADVMEHDFSALLNILYDTKRFANISTAVIDYGMPKVNGLDFCHGIQSSSIRKIMLTGEADAALAVDAFNQKDIDKFIAKKAGITLKNSVYNALYNALIEEQKVYFENLSSPFPTTHFKEQKTAEEFYKIFTAFEEKYKIVEWYQFDRQGSRLGLDADGNPHWLVIRSQEDMDANFDVISDHGGARCVVQALKDKTHLLFLFSEVEKHRPIEETHNYLFPIAGVIGDSGMYYSIINNNFFSLNRKKMVSYNKYRNKG